MDALSQALASIRLTAPLLARVQLGSDVAVHMREGSAPDGHCPFHYVAAGTCRAVMGEESIELHKGDLLVLPHWPDYRLETGVATAHMDILAVIAERDLPLWSPNSGLDQSLLLPIGPAPVSATILSGIFAFEGAQGALLLKDLPERICMNAENRGLEHLLQMVLVFVDADAPGRPGYAATASRLLEVLLVETLRAWALQTHHAPGRLRAMVDRVLARVLHAIHARPGHRWTLRELALIAGQSRSSFTSHFATVVGTTPAAYIAEWRCQLAERRLAMTREPIARLAADLGYTSSFAFSRAFRLRRGVTPAQYRRERRRGEHE